MPDKTTMWQIQNRSAILDLGSKTKKGRIAPSNKINYFCFVCINN